MDTKQIIFGLAAIMAVTFLLSSCKSKSNSADKLQFHPQGRDNGYILTIGNLRI